MVDRPGRVRSYRFRSSWRGPVRRAVLNRWGHRCAGCGWPGSDGKGKGLQLAHLVDHEQGGSDDESNLVPLCGRCHRRFDAAKRRVRRPS